ncbi:MAG: IMP dehydrogenase [Lentisphaeria bacterium]|nr:IMP dehydrogenase [Lentisphaeria bacterium]
MANFPYEGLTFDDVSLVTRYADFLPEEASLVSKFSRNITLNTPFVSAAMDTVTESEMAVAMASNGGIGVIHKNLPPELQANEVKKVKKYLNGMIHDPVTFNESMTVEAMLNERTKRNINFTGFPILNNEGKLCGIFTSKDLKFLSDRSLTLGEVMTSNLTTSACDTTLQEAFDIMVDQRIGKLPLINAKGELTGLYSFHDVSSLVQKDETNVVNRDSDYQLVVAAAISPYDYERVEKLVEAGVDALVVDTAHGHSKGVIETAAELKKTLDGVDIVAGNIATAEAAEALMEANVDAIKVGIGPGSICTTRVVCGVGVPQLSAIHSVAQAVKGEIPIIADGGIKYSGDVPKAFAVGASSVMMGSALAGTKQSPGQKILRGGREYVVYRGMGSVEAMMAGKGSRERYGHADVEDANDVVPQGIEGLVELRGPVERVLNQFIGGLRFSYGYLGARTMDELRDRARFVRISGAGLREAHPHDVKINKDAPNYTSGN